MLTNPINLSIIQNFIMMNEIDLQKNLDLKTNNLDLSNLDLSNLDLSNFETLKLYKMNLELQTINNRVNYLIYKLICLFNFLLSKKFDIQLFIK
jgi:hypothetical protein